MPLPRPLAQGSRVRSESGKWKTWATEWQAQHVQSLPHSTHQPLQYVTEGCIGGSRSKSALPSPSFPPFLRFFVPHAPPTSAAPVVPFHSQNVVAQPSRGLLRGAVLLLQVSLPAPHSYCVSPPQLWRTSMASCSSLHHMPVWREVERVVTAMRELMLKHHWLQQDPHHRTKG